ncbi:Hypothetical protein R9X50_00471300 [Acrodontium crateriforme]|uniref:FAD-binding FR-type domain-containing protein n=1 Tax=Acrodontium crateriforme TaxID=150365 RepID=A0AAQ3R8L1_9PEZI|nr:Hypothetical protein R9X50_00471300 [Acrodontium crateriforme]
MMDMATHTGTPWLDSPVMLHSSRKYKCSLPTQEQCKWQQGYWRFWYEADHRFALPTVALFMAAIGIFTIASFASFVMPASLRRSKMLRKATALSRYLSYRSLRIKALDWNSAPLGVLLLGAVGAIFFFCMTLGPQPYYWPNTKKVSYGGSPPIATRSGWMALACMPFVFATAGKSNFITLLTGVSHERLQVFHRWISYAMYTLALVHTFPFIVYHVWKGDMVKQWNTSVVYWTGVVALLAQTWLTFASFGPIRKLCYEWFKFSHFLAGLVFVIFFFIHCDFRLSSWDYFIATGVLFSLSWLHRNLRIYFEHGIGHKATLSLVSNGFIRASVPVHGQWAVSQHFFVRFLTLGLHAGSTHPFTACSLPTEELEDGKSNLVFYIRPQNGFTARLAKYVQAHPNCQIRVLIDGPYGGIDMRKIATCTKSVAIAGGSGAGWLLPFIEAYVRRTTANQNDTSSLRVILATRDRETQYWFESAASEILSSQTKQDLSSRLSIEIYYTGTAPNPRANPSIETTQPEPQNEKQTFDIEQSSNPTTSSHSSTHTLPFKPPHLKTFSFRPHLPAIIASETESTASNGSLTISVCGPLSMQSDASNEVARQQVLLMKSGAKEVFLHVEHFSWA